MFLQLFAKSNHKSTNSVYCSYTRWFFLFFFLEFSVSLSAQKDNGVFTKELVYKCIQNYIFNGATNFIGWSENGKAAWIDLRCDNEPSGFSDIFIVIQDFTTESQICRKYCGRNAEQLHIDMAQLKQITSKLIENKIFYAPSLVNEFPIECEKDTVSIDFEKEIIDVSFQKYTDDSIGINTYRDIVTLKNGKNQIIKQVDLLITGPHYFGNGYSSCFYYKSPYQNLIAIPYFASDIDKAEITLYRGENGMLGCFMDELFCRLAN